MFFSLDRPATKKQCFLITISENYSKKYYPSFIFLYSRFHRRWWKIRSLQTIHNCDVHTLSIFLHDSVFDWNPITVQLWIHQFNCFDIGLFHYISRWLKTKYQISLFWFLFLAAIQNQKMLELRLFVILMSWVRV